ncbi:hypothetical protein F0562_036117 [Nyssa sinensis]|uniref:Uncharacterized protein n=1 Tax=Nyssa sinensis TaxID=561372 RepID=A0A5J5AFZ6_9ASTE|nr:hypothetical protein F0562_036117 [Nyssa sinensis]
MMSSRGTSSSAPSDGNQIVMHRKADVGLQSSSTNVITPLTQYVIQNLIISQLVLIRVLSSGFILPLLMRHLKEDDDNALNVKDGDNGVTQDPVFANSDLNFDNWFDKMLDAEHSE